MKFEVTLKHLRDNKACIVGYNRVASAIKGIKFDICRKTYIRVKHDEPISLLSILESNGLDDAIWALRCKKEFKRDAMLFAVWCARQVQHLMTDERSIKALDVAEKYANGAASYEELTDAIGASYAVSVAASAAARCASYAASDAASAAAMSARCDASYAASYAAQKKMFIKMCKGEAPWQNLK